MSVPPTEPFRVRTNSEPLRMASEGLPALPPSLFVGHTLAFLVRWFLECPAGSYLCGFCRCPLRPHSDTCLRPLVMAQSSLETLLWGPSLLRCLPWPPYHSFTICVCHPHPVWCCEDLFPCPPSGSPPAPLLSLQQLLCDFCSPRLHPPSLCSPSLTTPWMHHFSIWLAPVLTSVLS